MPSMTLMSLMFLEISEHAARASPSSLSECLERPTSTIMAGRHAAKTTTCKDGGRGREGREKKGDRDTERDRSGDRDLAERESTIRVGATNEMKLKKILTTSHTHGL